MPYTASNPPAAFKKLPKGAVAIGVAAFNSAYGGTCKDRRDREECAFKVAWSAIGKKYRKSGDEWVPRAALAEVDMVITKASLQEDGTMRWQATPSDTDRDRTGERTSLSLFRDWIERAEMDRRVDFLPSPRVPFLGLSHYPALDGAGEAGLTDRMYVDGKQFKASGQFQANALGRALFDAVRAELETVKRGEAVEQPIRISAAWWDLEHRHGSYVFTRRSLLDVCPMCEGDASGAKEYLKGQLDHFAATRVPINPRTSLGLEEKSMAKITRQEDAASIVGEDLAEELEESARELVGKSEAEETPGLVVKAEDTDLAASTGEDEDPDVEKAMMKTVGGKRYPAGDFLVVEDAKRPSTWHLQVKRNGKPDHRLMGGAWAALFDPQGHRGNRYEGPGAGEAKRKLRALYKSEKMEPPTSKADIEPDVEQMSSMHDEGDYMPLGGALSLSEAETFIEQQKMADRLYTNWDMYRIVVENILSAPAGTDKVAAIGQVTQEFGDRVGALKSNVADAYLIAQALYATIPAPPAGDEMEKGNSIMTEQTQEAAQPETVTNDPTAVLGTAVKAALEARGLAREGKLAAIQEALNTYAGAVKAELDAVAPPAPGEELVAAIEKSMGSLAEKLDLLIAKLDNRQPPAPQAVPQQKSFAPTGPVPGGQPKETPVSPYTGQPSKLRAMIERSVGMHQHQ